MITMVPLNPIKYSMEFHETWSAPILMTREIPWNSMQLGVRQYRWHDQFHGFRWHFTYMECANFDDTSSSMVFHGIPWNFEYVNFTFRIFFKLMWFMWFSPEPHPTPPITSKLFLVYFLFWGHGVHLLFKYTFCIAVLTYIEFVNHLWNLSLHIILHPFMSRKCYIYCRNFFICFMPRYISAVFMGFLQMW